MDVAVVAVITSAIVGLAGVLAPAWLARRDEVLADKRRTRDRREAVYIDALELARLVSDHHVKGTFGDLHPSQETVQAAYERTHAERSIQARMDAYGSPEMRALWDAFDESWEAVEIGRQESMHALAMSAAEMANRVNKELA